jgi:hypothetical protein
LSKKLQWRSGVVADCKEEDLERKKREKGG